MNKVPTIVVAGEGIPEAEAVEDIVRANSISPDVDNLNQQGLP